MKLPAGLLYTGIVLSVLGPISVGAQQTPETLYEFPSDYYGHVFDPGHNAIYLVLTGRQALVRLNLTNGVENAALPLSLPALSVAMTQNRQWLFIGEGSTTGSTGKVAEIDLATGTLIREMDFPFSPRGLTATDSKLLIVSSPSADGQGPEVRLFDTASGAISARTVTTTYGPHTLDPSQLSIFAYGLGNRFSPVVRGFFDRTQLRFTSFRTSRYSALDGRVMVGTVVPFPDGSLLINEDRIYRGTPDDAATDMLFVKSLEGHVGGSLAVRFDVSPRGAFLAAGSGGLKFFRMDTLEKFREIPLGLTVDGEYCGDQVYAVVLGTDVIRRIVRVPNPAVGIETNQAPTAKFLWTPSNPTTLETVLLDGSVSSDDLDPTDQLFYRWDFNGDGVFDTTLAQSPVARYKFRVGRTNVITLEVRDRFGAAAQVQQSISIEAAADPGQPAGGNIPWQLPFAATAVIFDPIRPILYATRASDQAIVKLNLLNGLIERQWQLDDPPGPLAFRPDGGRLFCAMTTDDPISTNVSFSGWVAEFDPVAATKVREFPVQIYPSDLIASDSGHVIVHGFGSQGAEFQVYQTESGTRTGLARIEQISRMAFHPLQTHLYASSFDVNPSALQRFNFAQGSGVLTASTKKADLGGFAVFVPPSGSNVIVGSGRLLTSSTNVTQDMIFVRDLGVAPVKAMVSIPSRGLVGLLTSDRLCYFFEGSWTNFLTLSVPLGTDYLGTQSGRVYEVAVLTNMTSIRSRGVPASKPEENVAPLVKLTLPHSGQVVTLGDPVQLEADANDDDGLITSVAFVSEGNTLATANSPPFASTWNPTAPGIYKISAVAQDNWGAATPSPDATLIVNERPSVIMLDPAGVSPFLSPADITLEATAQDRDGTVVRVDFFQAPDGVAFQRLGSAEAPPFKLQLKDFIAPGGWIRAVATDNYGATNKSDVELRILALPGDDFRRPLPLSGIVATGRANNTRATRQALEPTYNGRQLPGTVWWLWSAPTNGNVTLTTSGSSFDTALQVFDRTNWISPPAPVVTNDDDPARPPTSRAKFPATAGTSYLLVISGTGTNELGDIVLHLEFRELPPPISVAPPDNDRFTNRLSLAGPSVTATGSNRGATNEPGEPRHAQWTARSSIWWDWIAPETGIALVSTEGSDFDTVLAIYRGTALPLLQSVASNDDGPTDAATSELTFRAVKDTRYLFAVDGLGGDQGNVTLALNLSTNLPPAGPPENDSFTNRLLVIGNLAVFSGRNNNATNEAGEPTHAAAAKGRSVWWTWTALGDQVVCLSARGTTPAILGSARSFSLALAVYQGSELSNLIPVARSTSTNGLSGLAAVVRFAARAGQTYHLAVDSLTTDTGDLQLALNATLLPATLQLKFAEWDTDGSVRLAVESSYLRNVLIQFSTNLVEWTTLQNVRAENTTTVNVSGNSLSGALIFFRLKSFE